jgi:hypothetical protein
MPRLDRGIFFGGHRKNRPAPTRYSGEGPLRPVIPAKAGIQLWAREVQLLYQAPKALIRRFVPPSPTLRREKEKRPSPAHRVGEGARRAGEGLP